MRTLLRPDRSAQVHSPRGLAATAGQDDSAEMEIGDLKAWIYFAIATALLLIVDTRSTMKRQRAEVVEARQPQGAGVGSTSGGSGRTTGGETVEMSVRKAARNTAFWIFTAIVFNLGLLLMYDWKFAMQWADGYMLEYLLSMDNLFVFCTIFQTYQTPHEQRRKALTYGIMGAVVFRLVFFLVTEFLLHLMWFFQIVFGGFLVWTAYKTATSGEDEEEPIEDNKCVKAATKCIPVVHRYDASGAFFIRVADQGGGQVTPAIYGRVNSRPQDGEYEGEKHIETSESSPSASRFVHSERDGTGGDGGGNGGVRVPPRERRASGGTEGSRTRRESLVEGEDVNSSSTLPSAVGLFPSGGSGEKKAEAEVDGGGEIGSPSSSSSVSPSALAKATTGGGTGGDCGAGGSLHGVGVGRETEGSPRGLMSGPARGERPEEGGKGRYRWKATLLFLVVVVCEVIDIVFAVDSVSAKVAQLPNVFQAYSSTVFAMFGLRSLFFILEVVMDYFSAMKYGLGLILAFIGIRLMMQRWVTIPEPVTFGFMITVIVSCMVASVLCPGKKKEEGEEEEEEGQADGGDDEGKAEEGTLGEDQTDVELGKDFHEEAPRGREGKGRQGRGKGALSSADEWTPNRNMRSSPGLASDELEDVEQGGNCLRREGCRTPSPGRERVLQKTTSCALLPSLSPDAPTRCPGGRSGLFSTPSSALSHSPSVSDLDVVQSSVLRAGGESSFSCQTSAEAAVAFASSAGGKSALIDREASELPSRVFLGSLLGERSSNDGIRIGV